MSDELFGFPLAGVWDYENAYHLTSHPSRMGKLLAQYELYRSICDLPGQVVECGVFKGASLIRFATFREVLESPWSRQIIGFDAFGKFPAQDDDDDRAFIERLESDAGDGIPESELARVFEHKGFVNYELVKGDVSETIPRYVAEHPELRIALLHIDVDVYRPTRDILAHLYDRVVPRGVVMLDDYGIVAGETRAIDEFVAERGLHVEKLPLAHRPAFVRKPDGTAPAGASTASTPR